MSLIIPLELFNYNAIKIHNMNTEKWSKIFTLFNCLISTFIIAMPFASKIKNKPTMQNEWFAWEECKEIICVIKEEFYCTPRELTSFFKNWWNEKIKYSIYVCTECNDKNWQEMGCENKTKLIKFDSVSLFISSKYFF